jgi:DUF4097 and DUF4098 domain-containing protein YvlB
MKKMLALFAVLCSSLSPVLAQSNSFNYDGVRQVTIQDVTICDVEIVQSSAGTSTGDISGLAGDQTVDHRLREGELLVTGNLGNRLETIGKEHPRISLSVPNGTEVRIKTFSGSVRIEGIDGGKWIETGGGSITVIGGQGNIRAESGSGDQRYDGIRGEINAKAQSGKIEVNNHVGSLLLETATGSIVGRDVTARNDCSFKAGVGSVDIDFSNPSKDFSYVLKSVTGKIEVAGRSERGSVQIGSGPIRITGSTTVGRQRYE